MNAVRAYHVTATDVVFEGEGLGCERGDVGKGLSSTHCLRKGENQESAVYRGGV
jgi:hypothetical protein